MSYQNVQFKWKWGGNWDALLKWKSLLTKTIIVFTKKLQMWQFQQQIHAQVTVFLQSNWLIKGQSSLAFKQKERIKKITPVLLDELHLVRSNQQHKKQDLTTFPRIIKLTQVERANFENFYHWYKTIENSIHIQISKIVCFFFSIGWFLIMDSYIQANMVLCPWSYFHQCYYKGKTGQKKGQR